MQAKLIKKQAEIAEVMTFWLEPEQPVEWRAGQYGVYRLPIEQPDAEGNERYFTIAAAPYENHLQITTRIRPSSFKQALAALEVGDTIELVKVGGKFVVDDVNQHYVFIAGGIGITPFRAILLDLAQRQQPIKVSLLYANRNDDIVFKDELVALAASHPDLQLYILVDPQRLDEATISQLVPDLSQRRFYVSGPEPMVDAVAEMLLAMGVAAEQLKKDHFPRYESI